MRLRVIRRWLLREVGGAPYWLLVVAPLIMLVCAAVAVPAAVRAQPLDGPAALAATPAATASPVLSASPTLSASAKPTASPAPSATPALFTVPKSPRLLILGDSTTAGYGASSEAKGYARLVGKALKWKTDISAVRGTGYTWGGLHGGKDDYGTRIKQYIKKSTFKPNVIVLEGSQYDYRSVSKVTGAVKKDVQLLRDAYPQAAIVLFGPAGPTSLQSRLKPIDAADQAAATALDVPYISPYQEHWLTSKNSKLFTKGHLNTAGHAYLAKKFVTDFKPLFGP